MSKKIIIFVLALASLGIFLPSEGQAAVRSEKNSTLNTVAEYANGQVRIRIGQPRRRYRRFYPGRRFYGPRRRVVRQVYYRNGRRYVRTVRY